MEMNSPLPTLYDPWLVALSIVIAVLASGAALDFAGRVSAARGAYRWAWLIGGAFVMGLGIWSMHYIGMLALQIPVPTRYHVPTVALSLLAAVVASFVALLVASRERWSVSATAAGSLVMGGGIAMMHYTGMAGMRLPAMMHWNPWLIGASGGIAIGVSAVAMWLGFRFGRAGAEEWTWRKAGSAILMGGAIPSMHYTGMAAAHFVASDAPVNLTHTIGIPALGTWAIILGTLLVLGTAFVSSLVDRRITASAVQLRAALVEVKTLRGLLPICGECKRIRNDQGSWQQIESYIRQHSEVSFTHGLCPECVTRWEAATLEQA